MNEVVEKIDYSNAGVVVTVFNTLENARKVYTSDFLINTMPLGYLKANYQNIFVPPLPLDKEKAIQTLGFGSINKFFVVFDKEVLARDVERLQLLWRDDLPFSLDSAAKWNLQVNK